MFHHERIATYGDEMVSLAERASDRWSDSATLDLHREMARLTLAIVGRTMFGTDIESRDAARIGEALNETLGQFDRAFSPFLPLTERLPLPSTIRFRRAREIMDRSIAAMIEQRRTDGVPADDLLSLLLRARDDDVVLDDTEVRDEAMTLFLAGHETTSNALTWTWLLLSEHPETEARLHEELDRVVRDRAVTAADGLPYAEAVVRESMRLYPPAWAIGRRAVQDHVADGVRIPRARWWWSRPGSCIATSDGGRNPARSGPSAGSRRTTPARAMRTSRSAVGRGCASARGSRRSRPDCCSQRSGGGGRSRTTPRIGWSCSRW